MTETHFMVTDRDFYGATLRAFVHPELQQIIMSAEDYKERKFVCDEFSKDFI